MDRTRQWGIAWVALAIAIAIHVVDEALTGFLPLYNSAVLALRETYPWSPLPTFEFSTWLSGLVVGVALLLAVSPLVFTGRWIVRPLSYFLGALMILNALGHVGISIYLQTVAPGTLSSPLLLLAAVALLVATARAAREPAAGRGS